MNYVTGSSCAALCGLWANYHTVYSIKMMKTMKKRKKARLYRGTESTIVRWCLCFLSVNSARPTLEKCCIFYIHLFGCRFHSFIHSFIFHFPCVTLYMCDVRICFHVVCLLLLKLKLKVDPFSYPPFEASSREPAMQREAATKKINQHKHKPAQPAHKLKSTTKQQ